MRKKKEINWKIVALCLLIVIIFLSVAIYDQYRNTYDFKEFRIDKEQLNEIKEIVGEEFLICEIDTNKCVIIKS